MILVEAKVGPFRSLNTVQQVEIDPKVTVLVGMNEAGKTVLLKALEKSRDALKIEDFDPVEDYPRKDLSGYLKKHAANPDAATVLTYRLVAGEVAAVNETLHSELPENFEITVSHYYNNTARVGIGISEAGAIKSFKALLSGDAAAAIGEKVSSLRSIPAALSEVSQTEPDKTHLAALQKRIAAAGEQWSSVLSFEVWKALEPLIPRFLYFSDYDLLPGKLNLADLTAKIEQAKADPKCLQPKYRAVQALLRMADVSVADLSGPSGYESLKAKIEAVSISLTDQVMEFWKQNEDLEVEVDIKADPNDVAPFNNGANLYLRIKNRRHRGVSTSFDQRSRGFIWFFSFLVWFDSVQHQLDPNKVLHQNLILLLDEPGLALHALAQSDFLTYIDQLACQHQVVYTTHSPFMVHSDRLHQVRLIEDRDKVGTTVTDTMSGTDPRTIFPLQAALGWTIAQNLFISERNLLVEGPSELIYLKAVSALIEAQGGQSLRDDITIVPVGGLDKVATFVALLGASGLKLAVLHDYRGVPEQKLEEMVRHKLLSQKALFNASQFRNLAKIGQSSVPTDTEDLIEPDLYLKYFNKAFAGQLGKSGIKEADLPTGDRIVERLERHIAAKGLKLRPSGGFNHYAVAVQFGRSPPDSIHPDTVKRFEALFAAINTMA